MNVVFSSIPKYLPVTKIGQCQRYKEYDIVPMKTIGDSESSLVEMLVAEVPARIKKR